MNGTISQLHKGGSTNKTFDQRPVVLLNSGYQLLNHIIAERLKRIVEQTNVLKLRHRLQKRLQCNVTGRSLARDEWCERCLLITESPKTPGHYRYLIWVLISITYTGLAVFSFAICSCSCVYCDFEFWNFVFSTLQGRSCWQLTNSCLLRGLEGSMLWIDIICFFYRLGLFSKCLLGVNYAWYVLVHFSFPVL